jgi:hypothetical protein
MLVPEVDQDWPPPSPPAAVSHGTLLYYGSLGHGGVAAASENIGNPSTSSRPGWLIGVSPKLDL